jgi:hypothetical protein
MRHPGRTALVGIATGLALLAPAPDSALAGDGDAHATSPPPRVQVAQTPLEASPQSSQKPGPPIGGESLEDVLLNKGVITMDDWIKIKAEEEYKSAGRDFRLDALENLKTTVESLPILTDKVNFGLNALQWLYTHQDAHVPEGKSQDNISIRRSEILFWGKINDTIPRWHVLYEFQSIGLQNQTPGCPPAPQNCATQPTGTAASATFFRESYIDFRPVQSWAPNLNHFRLGIFRMPFGIFTETSGGLRDVISSPYLTSVGSGNGISNGTAGTIEFIQERDFFIDARGKIANRLEYTVGIMNNNNFTANSGLGANAPKAFYSRLRLFGTDVSWVSFNVIAGESNNTNTNINGRGKGAFDRWAVDFRYTSKTLPGLMVQGEWQGHDGANQTTVGRPAQGACQVTAVCGGSGAPGVQRRTWYVLGKYLINDGLFQNWEPTVMYEQFDPSTSTSNDLYTRTILGLTYYFENFPPKVQSKIQFNYEFRHHQGNGPGVGYDSTFDAFAKNAFLVQFQIRFM